MNISFVSLTVGAFILTMLAPPIAVVLLPADYLKLSNDSQSEHQPLLWKILTLLLTNLLGLILILAGIIMLFTPGQGVLTIALGFLLTSLPGKKRALRYIATDSVLKTLNSLRARFGRAPLEK